MRGISWRMPMDELKAVLKVKKAIEKEFLISEFKEGNAEYIFDKVLNLMNKRHTKGYYYALAIEFYQIIQTFEIYCHDTDIFDKIKLKRLQRLTDQIPELEAEIASKKKIEEETDRYFEKHPEELLPDIEQD